MICPDMKENASVIFVIMLQIHLCCTKKFVYFHILNFSSTNSNPYNRLPPPQQPDFKSITRSSLPFAGNNNSAVWIPIQKTSFSTAGRAFSKSQFVAFARIQADNDELIRHFFPFRDICTNIYSIYISMPDAVCCSTVICSPA